jgi:hypothetical protein
MKKIIVGYYCWDNRYGMMLLNTPANPLKPDEWKSNDMFRDFITNNFTTSDILKITVETCGIKEIRL